MVSLKAVLCPIDFSWLSKSALAAADEIAACFGAELWVLHVSPSLPLIECPSPYPGLIACRATDYERAVQTRVQHELTAMITQLRLKTREVKTVARCGDAAEEIAHLTAHESINLVVIGTHGLSGWHQHTFGSVAGKVMHLVQCPVLVIPAPSELSSCECWSSNQVMHGEK